MKTRDILVAFLVGFAILNGPTAAAADELDPIVAQVVEMLAAGVSEELVLQWLENTDRRPADLGSQDMIALTEAGASEQLTTALLALVGEQTDDSESVEAGPAAMARTDELSSSKKAPPATRESSEGTVQARIQLRARRVWTDEPEPDSPPEQRWDVYLYLDGELVAWTRPSLQGEPVEVRRLIPSGRRELRVVLQRYEEQRRGWLHESLSVPTLIAFEATPGDPIEIAVEMKRSWGLGRSRSDGGPLSFLIRQGARVVAEHAGTGGNPDRWQPVCEDVEANFPGGEGVPRRFRAAMDRCVGWADLWSGPSAATSRAAILADLAEHDFEPPLP